MRIYGLGILAASLFVCAGCSICCTPYDECGPTAMSGLCNTRAGSVISYSGPQGQARSQQNWESQRSNAAPIPSAQPMSQPAATALPQMNLGATPYSQMNYAASTPQTAQTTQIIQMPSLPNMFRQNDQPSNYAWNASQAQESTATSGQVVYPNATYANGYEPIAQPQMAAIPEELRQRYPAGRSVSF